MNTNKEIEQIVRSWLDDRAVEPPHTGLALAMAQVATTSQQRRRWLGRWFDRGRGATRGAVDRGPTDTHNGRNRLMFGITSVTAGAAALTLIATLVVPRSDSGPPVIPAAGGGATHVVAADGSGDFTTISEAVAAAVEGDTVLVKPGQYAETVLIDKDITLQGDGARESVVLLPPTPAPVDAEGSTLPTFTVKDSNAIVRSLTVKPPSGWGSILVTGGAPLFEDVSQVMSDVPGAAGTFWFTDGTTAIVRDSAWDGMWYLDAAASPTLEGNAASGEGIIADGAITMRENTFVGCCLQVMGGAQALIEDNSFDRGDGDNTQPGIGVSDTGTTVDIVGNTVTGMATGISVLGDSMVTIKDNTLVDNQLGIGWSSTQQGAIEGNTVSGGRTGLVITAGSPTVTGNSIQGATRYGISIGKLATPTLSGNTVCGAGSNLRLAEGATPAMGQNDICADVPAPSAG